MKFKESNNPQEVLWGIFFILLDILLWVVMGHELGFLSFVGFLCMCCSIETKDKK